MTSGEMVLFIVQSTSPTWLTGAIHPAAAAHKPLSRPTLVLQVHDYCPYLYVPAPVRMSTADADSPEALCSEASVVGDGRRKNGGESPAYGGGGGGGDGGDPVRPCATSWSESKLEALRSHWNSR